jgi:hypothetical protein
MTDSLHIFFIHNGNQARRDACKALIASLQRDGLTNIKYTFCDKNPPDGFNLETLAKMIDMNQWRANKPHLREHVKKIPIENMSNLLNHFDALQLIAYNTDSVQHNIILEDDMVYDDYQIVKNLQELIASMPDPHMHHLTIIGSRLPDHQETVLSPMKSLDMCNAYYVSQHTAVEIAKNFLPIAFCFQHQIRMACQSIGIPIVFSPKVIFEDGSKMGAHVSSIQANNLHVLNSTFMNAVEFLNSYDEKIHSKSDVFIHIQKMKNERYSGNPDFMYIEAKLNECLGEHAYARKLYQSALQKFVTQGGSVRQKSLFVKDYENVCKVTQDLPPSTFST